MNCFDMKRVEEEWIATEVRTMRDYPTVRCQHSWDRLGGLRKGGFLAHRSPPRSEDETEIRAGERTGDRSREEDPSRDAATLLGGRQDPHCTGRPARRGQHRRALPPRGDRPEPLLPLVERLSRGREEATGWRYGPGRDLGRGQGPATRGQRAEGGRG